MRKNVAFIGPMGAGKSFIGERLAQYLKLPFVDIDHEVEISTGMTVSQLFKHSGQAAFRMLEEQALAKVLAATSPLVIATGGGCVLAQSNRELMAKNSWVVYLKVSAEVALARCKESKGIRPLLEDENPLTRWEAMAQARQPHYEMFADATFDTDHVSVAYLVSQIARMWGRNSRLT